MTGRNEEQLVRDAYIRMYEGMIAKDETVLRDVLDDSFVLVHMTGMRQSREEFINAVLDGTLNYYFAEHESMPVEINGDTAVLTGQSYVAAADAALRKSTVCGRSLAALRARTELTNNLWGSLWSFHKLP